MQPVKEFVTPSKVKTLRTMEATSMKRVVEEDKKLGKYTSMLVSFHRMQCDLLLLQCSLLSVLHFMLKFCAMSSVFGLVYLDLLDHLCNNNVCKVMLTSLLVTSSFPITFLYNSRIVVATLGPRLLS